MKKNRFSVLVLLVVVLFCLTATPALARTKTRIIGIKSTYTTSKVHLAAVGVLQYKKGRKWVPLKGQRLKLTYFNSATARTLTKTYKSDKRGKFTVTFGVFPRVGAVQWNGKSTLTFAKTKKYAGSSRKVKTKYVTAGAAKVSISLPPTATVQFAYDSSQSATLAVTPIPVVLHATVGSVVTTITGSTMANGNSLTVGVQHWDGSSWSVPSGDGDDPDSPWLPSDDSRGVISYFDPVAPEGLLPVTDVIRVSTAQRSGSWLVLGGTYYSLPNIVSSTCTVTCMP